MAPAPFSFFSRWSERWSNRGHESHHIIQTVSFVICYTPTDSSLLNLPLMDIIQFLKENKKNVIYIFSVCL